MRELHARASGLCQPDYVIDIPGGFAKAKLKPADALLCDGSQDARIRDADGLWHDYPCSSES